MKKNRIVAKYEGGLQLYKGFYVPTSVVSRYTEDSFSMVSLDLIKDIFRYGNYIPEPVTKPEIYCVTRPIVINFVLIPKDGVDTEFILIRTKDGQLCQLGGKLKSPDDYDERMEVADFSKLYRESDDNFLNEIYIAISSDIKIMLEGHNWISYRDTIGSIGEDIFNTIEDYFNGDMYWYNRHGTDSENACDNNPCGGTYWLSYNEDETGPIRIYIPILLDIPNLDLPPINDYYYVMNKSSLMKIRNHNPRLKDQIQLPNNTSNIYKSHEEKTELWRLLDFVEYLKSIKGTLE